MPTAISNAGNSRIRVQGMLMDQFKYDNGTNKDVTLNCRFVDSATGSLIGTQREMQRVSDVE